MFFKDEFYIEIVCEMQVVILVVLMIKVLVMFIKFEEVDFVDEFKMFFLSFIVICGYESLVDFINNVLLFFWFCRVRLNKDGLSRKF